MYNKKDKMSVILFVFGLIFGSFLNVVGSRYGSGVGILGRSFCPYCGKKLLWYELIPLLSYLLQRGRCRACKSKIGVIYPSIEIFTGVLFATLDYVLIPVFCIYVVILVYDLRHKIIPDLLVYLTIILSLIYRLLVGGYLLDWLAGPIIFSFFGLIWLLSKGRGMGFGDAKLGLSIGLLLGVWAFNAIAFSFWIGALVVVAYMILRHSNALFRGEKRLTMKSEIPFAPFMIIGAWLAVVLDINLLNVSFF